jgi:hypothetical protein
MNPSESAPQIQIPCRNLRCKEMYHEAPGHQEDEFSSGLYWCTKTHENFGPDGEPVGKSRCCATRACFGR